PYTTLFGSVLAFELVTAGGELLTSSAHENPDLFWALRGGGGNFGVVTAITYQLHPIGTVLGGMLIFPLELAAPALHAYQTVSDAAPDELIMHAIVASPPQLGTVLVIQACYSGDDLSEGERVLAPLRAVGPVADMLKPMAYADLVMMLTPPLVPGVSYAETAYSLPTLTDDAINALIGCAAAKSSPFSSIVIHQVRGAASRIAPDATAFALREPHLAICNIAGWMGGPAAPHVAWAEQALAAMQPFASRGLYVNFMAHAGEGEVRDAYRANYARLVEIKAIYDPTNVFRRNQNIKPA
ncbi:MAG: BBE domain-containing protein, partial [Chloroflexales bacterium]|nr:BBE domain-containing protein [Chloroflexales bacterium]